MAYSLHPDINLVTTVISPGCYYIAANFLEKIMGLSCEPPIRSFRCHQPACFVWRPGVGSESHNYNIIIRPDMGKKTRRKECCNTIMETAATSSTPSCQSLRDGVVSPRTSPNNNLQFSCLVLMMIRFSWEQPDRFFLWKLSRLWWVKLRVLSDLKLGWWF